MRREAFSAPAIRTVPCQLRVLSGKELGMPAEESDMQSNTSRCIYNIIQTVLEQGQDPNKAMDVWAEHDTPMGIAEYIEFGGWFPQTVPAPYITEHELDTLDCYMGQPPQLQADTRRRHVASSKVCR